MNKNMAIALLLGGGFLVALAFMWGKGDDTLESAPVEGGSSAQSSPSPAPALPVGPRPVPIPVPGPRPVPKPSPVDAVPGPPIEEESRFINPRGVGATELAKNQEAVVPWLGQEKKKDDGPVVATFETYTVETTMSLVRIAEDALGDGERWREILELNSDVIRNADRVARGTVLRIPADGRRRSLLDKLGSQRRSGHKKMTDLID